ncbi:MAG: hypothetical protein M1830_000887 [Pleopsidium flavum]|nr:MAG: hypothetical protein M1830_000887 [Pleopsidium flavum]
MPQTIQGALRQESINANRLYNGTISARQCYRFSITVEVVSKECFAPSWFILNAFEDFGGVPLGVTQLEAEEWSHFFSFQMTGEHLVSTSAAFTGTGWTFRPSLVIYNQFREIKMPMISFIYIRRPAADGYLDTSTAGNLIALAMEQYRLNPGKSVYTVSGPATAILCLSASSCLAL